MQSLEQSLDVRDEIERVGDDDDIEPSRDLEEFTGLDEEGPVGQTLPGRGNLRGGKINSRLVSGAQERKQFTGAAADLEHRRIGWNQQIVVMGEQATVGAGTA